MTIIITLILIFEFTPIPIIMIKNNDSKEKNNNYNMTLFFSLYSRRFTFRGELHFVAWTHLNHVQFVEHL